MNKQTARKPVFEEVLGLFIHPILALLGGVLGFLLLITLLEPFVYLRIIRSSWLSALGIYGPQFWLPNIFIGYFVNRTLKHRSAFWIWTIGMLYLFAMMASDASVSSWRRQFVDYLSPDERRCALSECIGQMFVTVPALDLITYSIGAWLGFRPGPKKD